MPHWFGVVSMVIACGSVVHAGSIGALRPQVRPIAGLLRGSYKKEA